jgi:hypothetical protein
MQEPAKKNRKLKIGLIVFSYFFIFLFGVVVAMPAPTQKQVVQKVPVEKVVTKEVPVEKIVTKEVTVEKTPQACVDVINTDNEIFIYIGNNIATYNFQGIADFVEAKTGPRTVKVLECFSKQ